MLIGGSLLLGGGRGFIFNLTASQNNFNLITALTAAGWNGSSPVRAQITVASGVVIGSTSTATAAFVVGALPAGSKVTLTNNGTSSGAGGAGGSVSTATTAGGAGGTGIQTASPLTIANSGTLAGGGGGGAATSTYVTSGGPTGTSYFLGGGGGAGTVAGPGGSATGTNQPNDLAYNYSGAPGTATAGGAGGNSGAPGYGGPGGALGAAGGGASTGSPGAVGAAGNYIIGNSFVAWTSIGTRLGGFS